jgi:hypothetical protein
MKRTTSFLLGVIVGAVILYAAMTYHVVRSDDGLHLVRKVSSGLGDAYVDIRQFNAARWNEHKSLAVALIYADKEELLSESAMSNVRQAARSALESLGLK